jgi:hypothetical protein
MPGIIKLGKIMIRHIYGILETTSSGMNSADVRGLNNWN